MYCKEKPWYNRIYHGFFTLMKFVIAGNKQEYDQFIDKYKLDRPQHRYVFDPMTIRGTCNPEGYFVGTWRLRKDIGEIVETMWLCMKTENPKFNKILNEIRSIPN